MYLGKMIEVTREAPANLGTAMKTIIARFEDMKKDPMAILEDGVSANKVETALASIGIALRDSEGEFRALQDVMDELGIKWETLTRNQQAYIATIAAGSRQQSRFLAMMNNYDRTLDLIAESQNSAGAAAQQYAIYQDSIAAAQARLTASWENFYSKVVDNDIIKTVINSLSSLVDVLSNIPPAITAIGLALGALQIQNFIRNATNAETFIGETITSFRLMGMAIQEGGHSLEDFIKLSPKLLNGFKGIDVTVGSLKEGFIGTGRAIVGFIKSNWQLLAILALVATAIAATNWVLERQKKAYEDAIKSIQTYQQEAHDMNSRATEGDALIERYDELSSKISLTEEEQAELNNTIDQIKSIYPEAIEYVDEYGNKQLANANYIRDNIELEKRLAKERQRSALEQRQQLLSGDNKNWKKEDFNNIGLSNFNSTRYFKLQDDYDFLQTSLNPTGINFQLNRSQAYIDNIKLPEIDRKTGAINALNKVIKATNLGYNELTENSTWEQITQMQQQLTDFLEGMPQKMIDIKKEQENLIKSMQKDTFLDLSFLDINYNDLSKQIGGAQKIISSQLQAMFQKMDLNIWEKFLNDNEIDIKDPQMLTAKIQEILDEVTEENAIELENLFKDLNSNEIGADEFYNKFNEIANESGSESAKNFIDSFKNYLDKQLDKEKEKFKEYLNTLGQLDSESVNYALEHYKLGSGNKKQEDINNYFTESNGPMQSMIDQYLRIDQEVLDSLDESVAKAIEEGNITALQDLPEQWIEKVNETDRDAANIILNGKVSEALEQLAATTSDKALEIADNIFTKKDYSSAIKATDLYNYREKLGDEWDKSYKVSSEGEFTLTDEAQRKIAKQERQENIKALQEEVLKIKEARSATQKLITENGDNNGELQKQVDSLDKEIDCFEELLRLARQLPDTLFESMDITEGLVTATKQLEQGYNKFNDSNALKYSAQVADEYKKVVDVTKELDKQMKEVKSVSEETMTQMLELGDVFSDFFTVHDDGSIEYGLQNIESQYETASEAILDIQRKRQEAELELRRQELDNEIKLNQAKMDGYNQIADALEEYANFKRNIDEKTTISQYDEEKTRIENQINAAQTSIQNAQSTWDSQVAAAKMAYEQMAQLDYTFWTNLSNKDIKNEISKMYQSFESINAPDFGLIDLNDLIMHGSPEELEATADKYRKAAEGLKKYIETLENAKKNLKVIDPTIYDTAIDKLEEAGKSGSEGFNKIIDAINDLMDALEDLDKLVKDVNRDLKDISIDIDPFTDLFEQWEHEWDYFYNIKTLISNISRSRNMFSQVSGAEWASPQQRMEADRAILGTAMADASARKKYAEGLMAAIIQKGTDMTEKYGQFGRFDPTSMTWYQRDDSLIDINKEQAKNVTEINRLQEEQWRRNNDLTTEQAKLEALEKQKSAHEEILSTLESEYESLRDNEDINYDTSDIEAKIEAEKGVVDTLDNQIETQKDLIKTIEDELKDIDFNLFTAQDTYDFWDKFVSDMESDIDDLNSMIADYYDNVSEMMEDANTYWEMYINYIETAINTEQELYDAIVENYQNEINEKKKQYDELKKLDNDYLQTVKDNIAKERQARDDSTKQKSYQQSLQRAQLLAQDTSGAYRKELANLKKDIEAQRQDLYDDLVDKQVEALEKEIEKRHELYDKEVEALEERLAYMQENAILLWEMVNNIVAEGSESMMAVLENTNDYINSNEKAKEQQRKTWELNVQKTVKTATDDTVKQWGIIAKVLGEIGTKTFPDYKTEVENYTSTLAEAEQVMIAYRNVIDTEKGNLDKVMSGLATSLSTKMEAYMTQWANSTSTFTGNVSTYGNVVNNMIESTSTNIATLNGWNNGLSTSGGKIIKTIDFYNEELAKKYAEIYKTYEDERTAHKNELETLIKSIQEEIEAAAKDAADAIRKAVEGLQNLSQSKPADTGTREPGGGQPIKPTGDDIKQPGGGSGSDSSGWKWRAWASYYDLQNNPHIDEVLGDYDSQEDALKAIDNLRKKWQTSWVGSSTAQVWKGYKQGGFADFTGPAWLDGTKSQPEAVLNAKQTRLFTSMVNSLEKASNNSNINSALGSSYNIGDINTNINVEKLDNETDIDRVARQVENRIMKSIRNRVSVAIA